MKSRILLLAFALFCSTGAFGTARFSGEKGARPRRIRLAALEGSACAIADDGAVQCWGNNDWGQLGDGTTTSHSTPVAVQGTAGIHFAAITAGQLRTCAVSESGAAYCWGSTPPASIPVPDAQHIVDVSVSLGDEACMLSNIGLAYCWGNNNFGQVGDSTQIPRPTPVAVMH